MPRKTLRPGYVDTPGALRRPRKSVSPALHGSLADADLDESLETRSKPPKNGATGGKSNGYANGHTNDHANGHANGATNGLLKDPSAREKKDAIEKASSRGSQKKIAIDGYIEGADVRIDQDPHFDFGGSWGVSAMMLLFPLLMWYMWIGATYYDGQLPLPAADESISSFAVHLAQLVYDGAFPSPKAWLMYWTFVIFEAACYVLLPGVSALGKPLVHEHGRQLSYHCSGAWSFFTTIILLAGLHVSGLFKLSTVLDEFGPLLSVAIASGYLVALVAYVSAWWRGAQHRMTGYPIYDFFMGAELNPRMFGILDFKMFLEVRIPWFILLVLSCSAAARQWERYGYVSGEVAFLVMAHFLYANACCKGEECIVTTWDIYYEKWGFMLIFWNLAGVPLSYCHCTLYLANHDPAEYRMPRGLLAALFVAYLFIYWIWDTTNSQKNRFRQQERGGRMVLRKAWPQLPWQTVENPQIIRTKTGDSILVDGWYGYARKIHYTCDLFFALSWGFVTGFKSPFPWFYPVFFTAMITHRAVRDIQRCQAKYGDAWTEYTRRVPYLFIPTERWGMGIVYSG